MEIVSYHEWYCVYFNISCKLQIVRYYFAAFFHFIQEEIYMCA